MLRHLGVGNRKLCARAASRRAAPVIIFFVLMGTAYKRLDKCLDALLPSSGWSSGPCLDSYLLVGVTWSM